MLHEASPLDFGWAIGLFEGEGSISVAAGQPGRRNPYPRMSLSTTDEDTVRRFAEIVGVGAVYGPYQYTKLKHNKPQWQWTFTGRATEPLLVTMWPYLGVRRQEQAHQAIQAARNLGRKRKELRGESRSAAA